MKRTKRGLSLLLALILVMGIFTMVPLTASAAYNLLFPVNNGGKIAYAYGYSSNYFNGKTFHNGIDIHSNGDDNIYAVDNGTVMATANACYHVNYGAECEHNNTFGNYIKIKHSNGTYSYYGHLKQNSLKVSVGDTVTRGQAIASMGSSGYSTGKHLHFELRLSDQKTKINVNPTSSGGEINYSTTGYNGTPTPSFSYTSINTGKYYLKHNATGKYMNVSYGTDANKQNVDLYDGFYTAEVMNLISTSYGYKMRPECCTSRVINAWGTNPTNGSNVNIYDDIADSTQSWKFQAVSGGYIIHLAYNTSLVLDNDNGNVCIKTYTGGSSQVWSLVPYHPTHSYDTYVYYWAEHPHYKCYKCSCGEVKENRDEPTYIDSCAQCRVGKTTVRSDKDVYYTDEKVVLSWDVASNATHYNFYIMKKESNGEYTGWIDWIREYKQTSYTIEGLSAGDYMISMYSYDSKHWEPDNSDWCHEKAEPIYFSVKEYEKYIETIDFTMEEGENAIPVSWSEVSGAERYEFTAVNNKGEADTVTSTDTSIKWTLDDSWCDGYIRVSVKAYDSADSLIGESGEKVYSIAYAHGDWFGDHGDVDFDGSITIKDATVVQKAIAGIVKFSEVEIEASDVVRDKDVNIKDATAIQKFIAGLETDSIVGEYYIWGSTYYEPFKVDKYESDWVLASQVPADAEITERKWSYDLTTTITSDKSSVEGYTLSNTTSAWSDYGSWSEWSKTAVSGSDSRQVETKTVTDKAGYTNYNYWIYRTSDGWGYGTKNYVVGSHGACTVYDEINLNYSLPVYNSSLETYGPYNSSKFSHSGDSYWFYGGSTWVPAVTHTEYRYRDRSLVYTYHHTKTESLESSTVPSGTGVSNVTEWVKYVVN